MMVDVTSSSLSTYSAVLPILFVVLVSDSASGLKTEDCIFELSSISTTASPSTTLPSGPSCMGFEAIPAVGICGAAVAVVVCCASFLSRRCPPSAIPPAALAIPGIMLPATTLLELPTLADTLSSIADTLESYGAIFPLVPPPPPLPLPLPLPWPFTLRPPADKAEATANLDSLERENALASSWGRLSLKSTTSSSASASNCSPPPPRSPLLLPVLPVLARECVESSPPKDRAS
mmetsp:Transcript_26237/g.43720  ORF Transcript_26237/g.43720 Transcript_26237/m.43720 type:complete len:234 (-) Transcript_26237:1196-1897(-)